MTDDDNNGLVDLYGEWHETMRALFNYVRAYEEQYTGEEEHAEFDRFLADHPHWEGGDES